MATIVQNIDRGEIRVATVFDAGKIMPVWFELIKQKSADRIFVKQVNSVWSHHVGTAKIITFAVSAKDNNNYVLAFNSQSFTWSLSMVESTPLP